VRLVDSFPGDACRGGDLLTGSSTPIREYQAIHQDRWGTVHRPERVLCLGIWIEEALAKPEGEVCFTESTVRSFGELVGMVPGELLDEVRAELEVANATIEHLRAQLAEKTMVDTVLQRAVNDAMNEAIPAMLVGPKPEDMSPAASKAAAMRRRAAVLEAEGHHPDDDFSDAIKAIAATEEAPPPSDDELAKLAKKR